MKKKFLFLVVLMTALLSSIGFAASAPEVTIVNPNDLAEFNYIPIDVDGTIDGVQIQLVEAYVYDMAGGPVDYQELSFQKRGPDYDFWGSVELVAGWNSINVIAWDKFNQFGSDWVEVCYDDPASPNNDCMS
ncbi:MAG: hypothetical protein KAT77_05465 [Nanoarchaeota archaeon]|nr:hypothetical protein [Nanoarchaeota archaeon]